MLQACSRPDLTSQRFPLGPSWECKSTGFGCAGVGGMLHPPNPSPQCWEMATHRALAPRRPAPGTHSPSASPGSRNSTAGSGQNPPRATPGTPICQASCKTMHTRSPAPSRAAARAGPAPAGRRFRFRLRRAEVRVRGPGGGGQTASAAIQRPLLLEDRTAALRNGSRVVWVWVFVSTQVSLSFFGLRKLQRGKLTS